MSDDLIIGGTQPPIVVQQGNDKLTISQSAQTLQIGAASRLPAGLDETVRVSAADTTSGFLNAKLVAGTDISLAILGGGGNETFEITSTAATETLQATYTASTPAVATLSAANGAVRWRDAAIPLGATLWAVQDNLGTTDFLSVSAAAVTSTVPYIAPLGATGAPSFNFGDVNTGIHGEFVNNLSITTGGSLRVNVSNNAILLLAQIRSSVGTAALPAFSYNGDSDTGAFSPGPNTWGWSTGTVHQWTLDSSGNFVDIAGLNLFDGRDVSVDGTTLDTHVASVANPHSVTMQQAYTATGGVPHVTLAAAQPFTIRDNAAPIGNVFVLEDTGAVDFYVISPTTKAFGTTTQRLYEDVNQIADYGGREWYPDSFTATGLTPRAAHFWTSTVTSTRPGGGGIGNEVAPSFVNWAGEIILTEQGNLFNTQSLFVQGTTVTCQGANTGPIYTMINQPLLRTGATGGSRTGTQQNAVRSQLRVGPNVAGNFALGTHEAYFVTVTVDATVGTASITDTIYFAPKAPTLTAGGTIGTLTLYDLPNVPAAGISTLTGIRSAMSSGTFMSHTGTAAANFGGSIGLATGAGAVDWSISHLAANIATLGTGDSLRISTGSLRFGSAGSVGLASVAANRLDLEAGDSFRISATGSLQFGGTVAQISTTTADQMQIESDHLAFGATVPAGTESWQVAFGPAAVATTGVAVDFSRVLFSPDGALTLNHAVTNASGFLINDPILAAGTGSATHAANLIIGSPVTQGTNRYGVYIIANPSGGGGVNHSLRAAGSVLFDDSLEIDGALDHDGTTIGFYGTTPAVQSAAYTRNAVFVENRTLLASASATTLNNNNVLAALIADLQAIGILG